MALKATVYKVNLSIADMDREYYATHHLTVACHPSETEHRLLVRLLAFALYANDDLKFTKGISTEDEPDIWQRDLVDNILLWIELGTPDEHRIRKGCHRAARMVVVAYGDRVAPVWWEKIHNKLHRFDNLEVVHFPDAEISVLAEGLSRGMELQVTVQDGLAWITLNETSVSFAPERWL